MYKRQPPLLLAGEPFGGPVVTLRTIDSLEVTVEKDDENRFNVLDAEKGGGVDFSWGVTLSLADENGHAVDTALIPLKRNMKPDLGNPVPQKMVRLFRWPGLKQRVVADFSGASFTVHAAGTYRLRATTCLLYTSPSPRD